MDTNEHESGNAMSDMDSTDFHGTNPCQSVKSVSALFVFIGVHSWLNFGIRGSIESFKLKPTEITIEESAGANVMVGSHRRFC